MEPEPLDSSGRCSPLIFWVDQHRHIRRANPTALSRLGLTANTVANQPMVALLAPGSQARLEEASEGQQLMELCRADGRRLWVTYSVQEAAGDELSAHIATPIGPEALDALLEERIMAERRAAHHELLGHVSHNVNNLLTTILAPAQLLLESTHDPDAREDILDILQATQRARSLLREMYRAVRFETETLESLELSPLLTNIATHPSADGLQITLALSPIPIPMVLGVSDGLRTILGSLISNAEDAGATELSLSTHQEGDQVLLHITDNGSGIEAQRLSRLFEPFATDKARVGAGLSLATSRTRLQGWGSTISVRSTPGAGCTFTISLQAAPRPAKTEPLLRGKVLLVEDEPIIARTLQRIFSAHEVDSALTANAALKMFAPGTYDAILIDLGLPEMPGNKLAERLRAQDPDISMLMLTGWLIDRADPRMRLFDGRIQKPFSDLAQVRQQLDEAIQRTRNQREK
jgi:signal transduction histidine kinase/CheY-like chemotaxis protein